MKALSFLLQITALALPLWRTGAYILSGLTSVLAIVYWIKNLKSVRPVPNKLFVVSTFYIICVIISVLTAGNYKTGFYFFVTEYIPLLILPFVLWPLFKNERNAHRIIYFFAFGLLISSVIIIYQGYGASTNIRPNGFIGHMNYAGAVVILLPALMAYIHGNKSIDSKLKVAAGCLIATVTVVASVYNGTRAIFLALGVSAFAYLMLFWRPNIRQATFALVIIGSLFLTTSIIKSSDRVKDFNSNSMSIVTRFQMWEIGFNTWKANPLFGVGVGQCPNVIYVQDQDGDWYTNLRDKNGWKDRAHLHNLFIQTLTETGIIGLLGVLTYWGYILTTFLRYSLKKENLFARVGFCGVVGFLSHSMTDYTYGITSEVILVSILITLAFSQLNNKYRRPKA